MYIFSLLLRITFFIIISVNAGDFTLSTKQPKKATIHGPNGGRPPFYSSPVDMANKIQEYFENCPDMRIYIVGKKPNEQRVEVPVITISGLCHYLGFADRVSFYDYEKKPEFAYTIKRARQMIELEYEKELKSGNAACAIFALTNIANNWKNKMYTQDDTPKNTDLTPEERLERMKELAESINN